MVACMGSSTIRISRRELGPTHEVVFNIHYNSFFFVEGWKKRMVLIPTTYPPNHQDIIVANLELCPWQYANTCFLVS